MYTDETLAEQNLSLDSKILSIADGSKGLVQNLRGHLIDLAGRQTATTIYFWNSTCSAAGV